MSPKEDEAQAVRADTGAAAEAPAPRKRGRPRKNPEAPAARATDGEIRPAPEIRSTLVSGETSRIREQVAAPDSGPSKRSIRATSGRRFAANSTASSIPEAPWQLSTQD